MLADYVVVKRRRIDVPGLFDPNGPYRYLNGVNVAAFVAIGIGVALYYSLSMSWLKIAWGLGGAAARVPRVPASDRLRQGADRRFLPALELALVDVALVRRPQLAPGQVALVDRVVELARRDAVADPVHVLDLPLECQVQVVVRLRPVASTTVSTPSIASGAPV